MPPNRVLSIVLCFLLLAVHVTATAQTITELQNADKLRIKTWIEPQENIIAKQQLNLYIEIATDKWFSGGTRIGRFEVKDAIVLQREKFAVNSTRTEGDKSWTVQMWTLVVYPQREGAFQIPTIPLRLSIAGENLESIIGDTNTLPLSFSTQIPEALQNKTGWIATTRFEVDESFNKSLDELKPGDALIRTINMSADNMPAMMLPKVAAEKSQGIALYQKPPQVTDKVNRGDYLAQRTEVFTYVFEKPGDYQLPAQTFYWWNLESQSLESIVLSAQTLKVSRLPGQADIKDDYQQITEQSKTIDITLLIKKGGAVLLILLTVLVILFKLRKLFTRARLPQSTQLSESELRRKFEKACRENEPEKGIRLFYQWLDHFGGEHFHGSVRQRLNEQNQAYLASLFNDIMRSIYTSNQNDKIDLVQFANQFFKELKKSERPSGFSRLSVELKLN